MLPASTAVYRRFYHRWCWLTLNSLQHVHQTTLHSPLFCLLEPIFIVLMFFSWTLNRGLSLTFWGGGGGGLDKFTLKEIHSSMSFSKSSMCHSTEMKASWAAAHMRAVAVEEEREIVTGTPVSAWRQYPNNRKACNLATSNAQAEGSSGGNKLEASLLSLVY